MRKQNPEFQRPDKDTIVSETRHILADPRFAPKRTFWQWLSAKLAGWDPPRIAGAGGIVRVLVWILSIWCVLTILAILAHLVWTLYVLAGPVRRGGGSHYGAVTALAIETMSIDQLLAKAKELAEKGAFAEALGFLMVSILRRLGDAGLVKFHMSKTNGDYVREYPPENPTKTEFQEFVMAFEKTVYGGVTCNRKYFDNMHVLSEEIVRRADEGIQN
ncbi:MAG: hypothetical protein ACYS8Z_20245, partial [Planctomycetota bacterium]|jgi:hypothetical protein